MNTPKMNQGYSQPYEKNIGIYKDKIKVFCELGISHGASLIAWKKWLPNAIIVGIDKDKETFGNTFYEGFGRKHLGDKCEDIKVHFGDAFDAGFLKSVAEEYGEFDVVLDDCSHIGKQMKIAFETLWDYTKYVYAIEDLQTQFNGNPIYTEGGNFMDYFGTLIKDNRPLDRDSMLNKNTFSPKSDEISRINSHNYTLFFHRK